MGVLLDFTRNSIWHAFWALSSPQGLTAPKDSLKVLLSSLGEVLECPLVSLGLKDYGPSDSLTFPQFELYLEKEVFGSSLGESLDRQDLAKLEKGIEDKCWIFFKQRLLGGKSKKRGAAQGQGGQGQLIPPGEKKQGLGEDDIYKLFRTFCLLGDLVRDQEGDNSQVLLCSEEADLVFNKFLTTLGREYELRDEFECLFSNAMFDFQTLLSVIELKFLKYFELSEVSEVITELFDEFVDEVVKMGTLLKRGEYLKKFVEKMVVLRPSGVTYYSDLKRKGRKVVLFNSATRVEEEGKGEEETLYQFRVITRERVLIFATLDKRYRSQWLSSIRLVLSRLHCQESYGRFLKNQRRLAWHRLRVKRLLETREMLEVEKQARLAAEGQAKELAVQKALEEEQRRGLEALRVELEGLLEEEIQAKRDEELVRSLQARILSEEWEKREELERLQEEQRKLLDMERNKAKTYEERQKEMEGMLEEAQEKLRELERARGEMDEELRSARLKNAERNKEILETRLRLFSAPICEDEKVRRARRSVSMREGHSHTHTHQRGTAHTPILPKITQDQEPQNLLKPS